MGWWRQPPKDRDTCSFLSSPRTFEFSCQIVSASVRYLTLVPIRNPKFSPLCCTTSLEWSGTRQYVRRVHVKIDARQGAKVCSWPPVVAELCLPLTQLE